MDIKLFNKDELSYEISIRGLQVGTVDEMRKLLRAALSAEKLAPSDYPEYPFEFAEDKEALVNKIEEVKGLVSNFTGDQSQSDYKRILQKINWGLRRLKRMVGDTAERKNEIASLKSSLILLIGELHTKSLGEILDGDSSSDEEVSFLSSTMNANSRSRVAIEKWNIRFSGEKGQSLNSFLERVSEVSEARGVTKQQLFKSALDLFEGNALIWYRAVKSKVKCWADLVRELQREYLPPDYDDRLIDEIKKRTQGKEESIGTYVAIMQSLFSRLTQPLSEGEQLKILRRNISPFYQTQMGLSDIKSIEELVYTGRKLEAVRVSVETFVPPPSRRSTQLLEPDLAYTFSERAQLSSVSSLSPGNRATYRCFNCNRNGHTARYCRQSRRCYRCGAENVIRANCANCNRTRPNRSSNPSLEQVGNGNRARQ